MGPGPRGSSHAGQEASSDCPTLGLRNYALLGGQGLNTKPQLTMKYKEQTKQQPGWIKEINAYKSALSLWKKGDTKHKAPFPSLASPSGSSEPHDGEGRRGRRVGVHSSGHPVRKRVDTRTQTQGDSLAEITQPTRQRVSSGPRVGGLASLGGPPDRIDLQHRWGGCQAPRGSKPGQGP